MVCKLTDDGYAEADKASKRIAAAFSEHPNWHSSDGELREARQEVTFALITVEDDLTKVTKTVDVRVASLSVRPMRRKWASCSTAGTVSFSTELLHLDGDLVDYVIVHELLHLRAPNHGRLWKSLMRAYLGEYEELHQRLEEKAGSVSSAGAELAN